MKKAICILLSLLMIIGLAACSSEKKESKAEEGFKTSLDSSTKCKITVAGG